MRCSFIGTFLKTAAHIPVAAQRQMSIQTWSIVSQAPYNSCCFPFSKGFSKLKHNHIYVNNVNSCSSTMEFRSSFRRFFGSCSLKQRSNYHSLTVSSKGNCNVGPLSRPQRAYMGLVFGLLVCCSSYKPVHAEIAQPEDSDKGSFSNYSQGKKVYKDYSVTGIPGDGRCLFRSVAHGACLRSGKLAPNESLQRELADDLRARVADEFVKRRKETEWFIEGNFDVYVSQIRKPHVWGGEPELFMASHVLKMPITVYMYDEDSGGLISIAEYGEEYGKENPIRVLYHGCGHYDALQMPSNRGAQSRL